MQNMISSQKKIPNNYQRPNPKIPPPFNIHDHQKVGKLNKNKNDKKRRFTWSCCFRPEIASNNNRSEDRCRVDLPLCEKKKSQQTFSSSPSPSIVSYRTRSEEKKPAQLHIPHIKFRDQEWSSSPDISSSKDHQKNNSLTGSRRESASNEGYVETQVFWEALWPVGWRTFESEVGQGIEKAYQTIIAREYNLRDENYSKNWWCDGRGEDDFVYCWKHYKVSPLFMVMRNMFNGCFTEIRRKKVELQSSSFRRRMSKSKSLSQRRSSSNLIPRTSSRSVYTPPHPKRRQRKRKKRKSSWKRNNQDPYNEKKQEQHLQHENSLNWSNVNTINFKNYRKWTTAHVCQWLRILNFPQYCNAVQQKGVTGRDLVKADINYLCKELDMTADHAVHILGALKGIASDFAGELETKTSSRSSTPYLDYHQYYDKRASSTIVDFIPEIEFPFQEEKLHESFRRSILLQPHEHDPSETTSILSSMSGPPPFDRFPKKRSKSEILRTKLKVHNPIWEQRVKRASSPTQPKCAYVAVNSHNSSARNSLSQQRNRLYDNFVVKEQFAHDLFKKKYANDDNKCEQTTVINLETYQSSIFEDEELETSLYGDEETGSSANLSGKHTKLSPKVCDPNSNDSNKENNKQFSQLPSIHTEKSEIPRMTHLAARNKCTADGITSVQEEVDGKGIMKPQKTRHATTVSKIETVLETVNINKLKEDILECFEDSGEKLNKRSRVQSVGNKKKMHKRINLSRGQSFDCVFASQDGQNPGYVNTNEDLNTLISKLDTVSFEALDGKRSSDEITVGTDEKSPDTQ